MVRGESLLRRSAWQWSLRCAFAVVAAIGGFTSVASTFGYTLRSTQPELARALAPADGRVAAGLSRALSGPSATNYQRVRADRLARQALRTDPTAVAAVWTLGVNALLRGDPTSASKLLAYANRLSRRDLPTQIWAIEDAVARNDIAGALRHYDIALRVSRKAPDILYPILAAAISDHSIRESLVQTLISQPVWGALFIDYVSGNGPDAQATASLFLKLRQAGVPISQSAEATMVSTLAARVSIDAAWAYYVTTKKNAQREISRDPDFNAHPAIPSLFDWRPLSGVALATAIQSDNGGVFEFSAPASAGGPLLQQTQMLPPGDYVLEGRSIGVDQPDRSRPYWSLTCESGREVGRIILPNSSQKSGFFTGRFTVPAGCTVQALTLVARPSELVSGLAGQLDRAQLFPAR